MDCIIILTLFFFSSALTEGTLNMTVSGFMYVPRFPRATKRKERCCCGRELLRLICNGPPRLFDAGRGHPASKVVMNLTIVAGSQQQMNHFCSGYTWPKPFTEAQDDQTELHTLCSLLIKLMIIVLINQLNICSEKNDFHWNVFLELNCSSSSHRLAPFQLSPCFSYPSHKENALALFISACLFILGNDLLRGFLVEHGALWLNGFMWSQSTQVCTAGRHFRSLSINPCGALGKKTSIAAQPPSPFFPLLPPIFFSLAI